MHKGSVRFQRASGILENLQIPRFAQLVRKVVSGVTAFLIPCV
jgi:hypothetical protein